MGSRMSKPAKGGGRVARAAVLGVALGCGAALSGCIGYSGDFDRGYQADDATISQLKVGATTKPEALNLLGTPSTTSTVGGDAWYYVGQKMHRSLAFMPLQTQDQHVLAVYFDKGGKVDHIANYGLQDGKVFDFISRTTPTGGQEANIIRQILSSSTFTPKLPQ